MEEITVNGHTNYILLFSGGLDSTFALVDLALQLAKNEQNHKVIWPISINYGQFAAEDEWNSVRNIVKFIQPRFPGIIKPPIRMNLKSDLFWPCKNVAFTGKEVGNERCEIPNRNIVLLSALSSYLKSCAINQNIDATVFEIHTGLKEGEMRDCNKAFIEGLQQLLTEETEWHVVKIMLLPNLLRNTFKNRLKKVLTTGVARTLLSLTISCYSPIGGKACGICWKCKDIKEEEVNAGRRLG